MTAKTLKPQYFQILLALADQDLHGYGIQRAVLDQTDQGMRLWPAMLYRSLAQLEERGMIARADPPADEPDDERRQYYALSSRGRECLRIEGERMARWATAAARAAES